MNPRLQARIARGLACLAVASGLAACNNSPYPDGAAATNTLFYSFDERSPRYLDPTASYANPESAYTYQIYEPLYGYHYLKRPYELVPKAAAQVAKPYYLDKAGQRLPDDRRPEQIAQSVYEIPIKKGIRYAPHPGLRQELQGRVPLSPPDPGRARRQALALGLRDQGSRELVADDFVYALKRHATTRIEAPVFAVFAEYVLGLKAYGELIKAEDQKLLAGLPRDIRDKPFLDFRKWPLEGADAPDPHLLRIRLKGKYPQWNYWMAMPFVAPIPWEADAFYAQPGMADNGLSLNQWPVGTGPFMMTEFIRDRRHVMKRNPAFRGEPYPCEGEPTTPRRGCSPTAASACPSSTRST
jgi:ABC-type oligopeptide transport system substrate-binding subunit